MQFRKLNWNTPQFYVRAASGTSSTVSDGGDTTTNSPMTVGIQLNIPLSSPREQREFAQQALSEATRIDEVRGRVLTDLAKLRELEAERAAVQERRAFIVGARYLAMGTGDTELYIFAGMLAAVVIAVRVFLFRGPGGPVSRFDFRERTQSREEG